MADDFRYDVFLSHSTKDKAVVRPIAERLREDGLRVWLDEWEIRPGDSIPAKIEEGLEQSRVLVLCMSEHAFGSDWAALESQTFRFRDPLNRERRFIPIRLDNAPLRGSLAQFLYINWTPEARHREHARLLDACRPPVKSSQTEAQSANKHFAEAVIRLDYHQQILSYAFSPAGDRVLSAGADNTICLWDMQTGRCLRVIGGHVGWIWNVVWSRDLQRALSCSQDHTLRLWDIETGRCLRVIQGHSNAVNDVAWSTDQRYALSASDDHSLRLWDLETGQCLQKMTGHTNWVTSVSWTADQRFALSGSKDNTLRQWDLNTGRCLQVLEGHTNTVLRASWSTDQQLAISGSRDNTARLWNMENGRCLRVLEGHIGEVWCLLTWSRNQSCIISGSSDNTIRLWDLETGRCLCVLEGHTSIVRSLEWKADHKHLFSGDERGSIHAWNLEQFATEMRTSKALTSILSTVPDQVQYTNAKVLLVGESGVGKTGLSKRLTTNEWQLSDSTVGAWATQWKLPVSSEDGIEREIWLWDFGGQADQRLIHQLYMDETAMAVLVFDGQKDDVIETLGQWDRDITRASNQNFSKLLVAGRVDAGGLRVSRSQVESFRKERGYLRLIETSAKTNLGCPELKQEILDGIRWEDIPWRSSPLLFKRLKEEIIRLKDEGRVLMRFNELREALTLRLSGEDAHFTDAELRAVINLLAGPGIVWELKFGNWVLLQPERINAYAQAVIQTMRDDKHERGCLPEERILKGDLTYHSSMGRLEATEERFVLLAMHQTLVDRGLCLREHTHKGTLLVFPSYYRRERPELVGHPAVLVSYRFSGFLDEIYATLVVRLHHTRPFEQDQLWRYAADFKTLTGKQLGLKLTRRAEGVGELEVYFDPAIPLEEKIIFSKYVHEHLQQSAKNVLRLRHYVCPHCGTPVGNREVAMKRLKEGKVHILCVNCEKNIPLWDKLEELFASAQMELRVHDLQGQSAVVLESQSRERALVGEVISTVALAGQISRELTVSDHGIDMEVEFKSDTGGSSEQKLYLQLRPGGFYNRKRDFNGREILIIKDDRHARYWMTRPSPVLLVIRNSEGQIQWMEIRDYLRIASDNGKRRVRQIAFEGERFDVMSVRRWRDKMLSQTPK